MTLLGALDKETNKYVTPFEANKKKQYKCPECLKDLIIRKGDIKIHHFAHKSEENKCIYYSSQSETQIHKDAKLLLKQIIENKTNIQIIKNCLGCNNSINYNLPIFNDQYCVKLEYGFNYNGSYKIADLVLLKDGQIIYIIEIVNTHKTADADRPEPWYELNAKRLLETYNDYLDNKVNQDNIILECERSISMFLCEECKTDAYNKECKYCKRLLLNENFGYKNNLFWHTKCKNLKKQLEKLTNEYCYLCGYNFADLINKINYEQTYDNIINDNIILIKNNVYHKICWNNYEREHRCDYCFEDINIDDIYINNMKKYHKNCNEKIKLLISEFGKRIVKYDKNQKKCNLCMLSLLPKPESINCKTTDRDILIRSNNRLYHKICYEDFKLDKKCDICQTEIKLIEIIIRSNKKYHERCHDNMIKTQKIKDKRCDFCDNKIDG
jgi:hypothetical protein